MVIPGNYFVKFRLPGEYQFTLDNRGPNDGVDSDVDGTNGFGTTECFEVEANEEQLDIDAGAYLCVEVGDLVWLDYIRNNVYDEGIENGVNGLKVKLYRFTDGAWVLWDIDFTTIDENSVCGDGYYHFCTNPGKYYIEFVTPPSGIVPAQPHRGGDITKDSDITRAHGYGTTNTFYLVSGTAGDLTIDAGYTQQAKVNSSMVWMDENANGLRDAEETGVPGVNVEIYDINGEVIYSKITGNDGSYDFDYLQAEDYYIKFNLASSSSYTFTPSNQGDDTKDSDVTGDYGYGTTEMFALVPEQEKKYIDAGLTQGTLPLDFIQLGAQWKKSYVEVAWVISNELNVEKFKVQRALEGNFRFTDIGEITISDKKKSNYSFDDRGEFENGVYYYRVVAVDFDGNETLSNKAAVFVNNKSKEDLVEIYPNPVANEASVKFSVVNATNVQVDVFDITGKMALENVVNEDFGIGNYEVKVDVRQLKPATYYLRLKANNKLTFKKMIVIKK